MQKNKFLQKKRIREKKRKKVGRDISVGEVLYPCLNLSSIRLSEHMICGKKVLSCLSAYT